jgi:hypothetical protein
MVSMPGALFVELLGCDGATETIARFQVRDQTNNIVLRAGLVEIAS